MIGLRSRVKHVLGQVPVVPEAYQSIMGQPVGGFDLTRLSDQLPSWVSAAGGSCKALPDRKVLVVGSLSWWIEFSSALAIVLAGRGCRVDYGYLPYRRWTEPVSAFDRRRQSAYVKSALRALQGLIGLHDLSITSATELPSGLSQEIDDIARFDVQYTFGRESLNLAPGSPDRELLDLRSHRNGSAAAAMLRLLEREHYDVVVIPNGGILEFGAFRAAARWHGALAVTYEFGEQRERIWVAQNDKVMRQDMSPLWKACEDVELSAPEFARLGELFAARRGGRGWEQFKREWQPTPSGRVQAGASQLGIDRTKPVVLLCTNVMGDSLAIEREVFTRGMGDWLAETVRYFANPDKGQLVVRIHPGELLGAGYPSTEIVRSVMPELPEHVMVVPPNSDLNTYDLIDLADLGLVYTTTVGLEMAAAGIPVIVAGRTHYRARGFTYDPESLDEYFNTIERLLTTRPEVNRALADRYAYRFFFDYPFEFPWHLLDFWDDVRARPVEDVVQSGDAYDETLRALVGEPVDWASRVGRHG